MPMQKRRPLIFAHRGASAYAPENTLAAFELAIQQGPDLVELDAKLSKDRRVVIIHDLTVDRTTDGSGRVADLTFDELRKFNASFLFRDQYPDQKIPTLEEVLDLCRGKIRINIELTNYFSPFDQLAVEVSRIINHYQVQEEVIVSAFHPIPLNKFHALSPEVQIGFLARKGWQGYLSRSWLGRIPVPYDALHPEKSDVTPELIAKAHNFGCPVHAFTVKVAQEMKKLISLGVDGLFTPDPLLAQSEIETFQPDNS
jgi:glycerophosphoryl diester phosphodiesterase